MPIYEFVCCGCGYEFEELMSIRDNCEIPCPKCEGKVEKKVSFTLVEVNYKNAKELVDRKLKKEIKEVVDKIKGGNENLAANIFGEDK